MRHHLRTLIYATGICLGAVQAGLADGTPMGDQDMWGNLRVGRTGILCYQAPCPWYGIARANQSINPYALLWSGDTLPTMRGSSEDQDYLRENYGEGCTLVNGRLRNGVLEVAKILGSC